MTPQYHVLRGIIPPAATILTKQTFPGCWETETRNVTNVPLNDLSAIRLSASPRKTPHSPPITGNR